jgi:hypothetical protein
MASKKSEELADSARRVARVTGLEPATSGVTGRRSNQLSYTRIGEALQLGRRAFRVKPRLRKFGAVWAVTDSNRRPSRCKRDALPLS